MLDKDPYDLGPGGATQWLLIISGIARCAELRRHVYPSGLYGVRAAWAYAYDPYPRDLKPHGLPADSYYDFVGRLRREFYEREETRQLCYIGTVRDEERGYWCELLSLWAAWRGRAPWEEAFIHEVEPSGIWRHDPPEIFRPRPEPPAPTLRQARLLDDEPVHPATLYVAFWQLEAPTRVLIAEAQEVLLKLAARCGSDPEAARPDWVFPTFCGRVLLAEEPAGAGDPLLRFSAGEIALGLKRIYEYDALRRLIDAETAPQPAREAGARTPEPADERELLLTRLVFDLLGAGWTPEEIRLAVGEAVESRLARAEMLRAARRTGGPEAFSVVAFLEGAAAADPAGRWRVDELQEAYRQFCQREGFSPVDERVLGRTLAALGVGVERGEGGARVYLGVRPV